MGDHLLAADGITRRFGTVPVLDAVSFTMARGSLTLLTGANGSGKTTLVNCLTGFDPSHQGQVTFRERPLRRLGPDARARLGVVRSFQYPHLFGEFSVTDHLALASVNGLALWRVYFARWADRPMADVVDELQLQPLLDRRGHALSLGEMKVVNLARALSTNATVLFLDEPLASLHGRRRQLVVEAIVRRRDRGCALLVIEHETHELDRIADARYELCDGHLIKGSRA